MEKIPTAEEFIPQYWDADTNFMESIKNQMSKIGGIDFDNIPDLMIEFAKLHVEAALKAAAENAETYEYQYEDPCTECGRTSVYIKEDSILNAYPLSNIQ
jgi:hypothetical protein